MKTVLHKAVVYSRMSPLHKAELVVGLQELGLTVGMCGDGANVSTSIGVTWASLLTNRLGLRCSEGSWCWIEFVGCWGLCGCTIYKQTAHHSITVYFVEVSSLIVMTMDIANSRQGRVDAPWFHRFKCTSTWRAIHFCKAFRFGSCTQSIMTAVFGILRYVINSLIPAYSG